MPPNTPIGTEAQILSAAQRLIENNLISAAEQLLKQNNIKAIIKNGRIQDSNDVTEDYLDKFITVSPPMIEVKSTVRLLSRVDDPVLITGPTGTGKEILANALHGKRDGKFQACNAAGLPEQLIESELFGHTRGAFTGAHTDKVGLIVMAKNGTFFLDEIGELPIEAQGKLLRVLQEKKVRRVGGTEDIDINCRFVFATNKNIKQMCLDNKFRIDLYARISTFEVFTTGLTDRPNDINPIASSLGASNDLIEQIKTRELPFNVRSIEQLVRRFKVLGKI